LFITELPLIPKFGDQMLMMSLLYKVQALRGSNIVSTNVRWQWLFVVLCFVVLQAPFYSTLSEVVKVGCQAAIWLAKRIWCPYRQTDLH